MTIEIKTSCLVSLIRLVSTSYTRRSSTRLHVTDTGWRNTGQSPDPVYCPHTEPPPGRDCQVRENQKTSRYIYLRDVLRGQLTMLLKLIGLHLKHNYKKVN